MNAVWTSLIAVAGTIAGTNLGAWWNARNARAERNDRRRGEQRDQLLSALADLVSALADHRRAMVVLGQTRLDGGDEQGVVAATHETRSAISAPLTRVRILGPGLAEHATKATQATYALHDVPTDPELRRLRQVSVDAVAELEKAAGQLWHTPAVR